MSYWVETEARQMHVTVISSSNVRKYLRNPWTCFGSVPETLWSDRIHTQLAGQTTHSLYVVMLLKPILQHWARCTWRTGGLFTVERILYLRPSNTATSKSGVVS